MAYFAPRIHGSLVNKNQARLCDNIKNNVFSQEWLFALTNYKESNKNFLFDCHPGLPSNYPADHGPSELMVQDCVQQQHQFKYSCKYLE